jgi:ABC-type Co2+ transport system permease subunit
MHIEPGYVSTAKVALANVTAVGFLGSQAAGLFKKPQLIVRSLLAALFFTVFMQSFHMPVGPSELHFVGAMPMYLTLGFLPTLFGFAIGLALQGALFTPTDLVHLGVNTLSLALPLAALHATIGRRVADVDVKTILKFDAFYYSGVTLMVGFWLAIGEVATPLSAWATFASSYLAVVMIEPVFTYLVVKGLGRARDNAAVRYCFDLRTAV